MPVYYWGDVPAEEIVAHEIAEKTAGLVRDGTYFTIKEFIQQHNALQTKMFICFSLFFGITYVNE